MPSKATSRPQSGHPPPKPAKAPRGPKRSKKERYFECLSKKLGPVTVRGWLEVFGVVLGLLIAYSILFVRRQVIEYRPAHTFSVRAPEFFSSAHAAAEPVAIGGNKVTLLHNGEGTFPVLLEAIHGAQKTVNFEAFLFHSGAVGTNFIRAFCERAQAGVEVRILLDGIGSGAELDDGDVKILTKAGCKFAYFHPTRALRVDRINRRSHRRVLVVDGNVAFTGGIGFADEWLGNADSADHWRDVHAQIEGPIVAKFQSLFQQHWLGETSEILSGDKYFPALAPVGTMQAQVTGSHEFSVAPLPLIQAVAIAAAEKTIYITNPYCTPTSDQVDLLTAAVKRGVDVRLLVPGPHNDQPMTKAAGRSDYGELLDGGVKIFEYTPTMIHSKTLVVDGLFAMLGTSNLDARSSQINDEIDLSVYDTGFGAEMEKVFLADLKNSAPYTAAQFNKRSLWERLSEWAILPFRSQL